MCKIVTSIVLIFVFSVQSIVLAEENKFALPSLDKLQCLSNKLYGEKSGRSLSETLRRAYWPTLNLPKIPTRVRVNLDKFERKMRVARICFQICGMIAAPIAGYMHFGLIDPLVAVGILVGGGSIGVIVPLGAIWGIHKGIASRIIKKNPRSKPEPIDELYDLIDSLLTEYGLVSKFPSARHFDLNDVYRLEQRLFLYENYKKMQVNFDAYIDALIKVPNRFNHWEVLQGIRDPFLIYILKSLLSDYKANYTLPEKINEDISLKYQVMGMLNFHVTSSKQRNQVMGIYTYLTKEQRNLIIKLIEYLNPLSPEETFKNYISEATHTLIELRESGMKRETLNQLHWNNTFGAINGETYPPILDWEKLLNDAGFSLGI